MHMLKKSIAESKCRWKHWYLNTYKCFTFLKQTFRIRHVASHHCVDWCCLTFTSFTVLVSSISLQLLLKLDYFLRTIMDQIWTRRHNQTRFIYIYYRYKFEVIEFKRKNKLPFVWMHSGKLYSKLIFSSLEEKFSFLSFRAWLAKLCLNKPYIKEKDPYII